MTDWHSTLRARLRVVKVYWWMLLVATVVGPASLLPTVDRLVSSIGIPACLFLGVASVTALVLEIRSFYHERQPHYFRTPLVSLLVGLAYFVFFFWSIDWFPGLFLFLYCAWVLLFGCTIFFAIELRKLRHGL